MNIREKIRQVRLNQALEKINRQCAVLDETFWSDIAIQIRGHIAYVADSEAQNAPPRNCKDQRWHHGTPYRECTGSVPACHAKFGHHEDPRPHHCLLPQDHEGRHFCHICGIYWDAPNAALTGGGSEPSIDVVKK